MNYGGMNGCGPRASLNMYGLSCPVRLNPAERGGITLMFDDDACCV